MAASLSIMTPARVLTFASDVPPTALALLAADGPAALLVDVASGRIPAANTAGSALLGLDGFASPLLLDASMPALARLRELARTAGRDDAPGGSKVPERLVFWGRNGAVAVRCRVQVLGGWPQGLVLVVALDERDLSRTAGPDEAALHFPDGEAARLKEIARRIREGQMTRLQPPMPRPEATPPPEVPFSIRSSLAHELKTPLSAIAAAAEIMQDERFGPIGNARYAGYARDIHGSARHVLSLIDRMLADGRAAPKTLLPELDIAEIDVGALLNATVSQLIPLAERAGLTLTLDLMPRPPHVIADATSLRQIVFNLVTNALKFTTRGGRITVAARYDGDGPLSIVVSDTGPGLDPADVERLLAPGGVPRRDDRADRDGLGLGLPLVQALAAANGATLSIESELGKGTAASVVFGKGRVVPV